MKRLAALLLAVVAACGSGERTELTVFAASSLTDAFTEIGRRFERDHGSVSVLFNFAASSTLVRQIRGGAGADVFAAADERSLEVLRDDVGEPTVFATNRLAIAVAPGNPTGIGGLNDLARPGTIVALCAPEVPCGTYAREALRRAGVTVKAASQEENVRAVATKVRLGEADAGIVYRTDVRGGDIDGVEIATEHEVAARYPVAVVRASRHGELARAFVALLRSDDGRRILRRHGFDA